MSSTPESAGPQPAILYVDDEETNRRVFVANFQGRFPLLTARCGEEALAVLVRGAPTVGVLLTDQRMPGMSGVELLERAREVAPQVARMVLTAFSDVESAIDAVNRGRVARYFVKPWNREQLSAALQDALRIFSLEQRLHDVEARMRQSERLAAVGQVAAGIAHELLNPVTYLTQNVRMLEDSLAVVQGYLTPALAARPDAGVARALEEMPQLLHDVAVGAKHVRQVALGMRAQARADADEAACELEDVAGFAVKLVRAQAAPRAPILVEGPPVRVRGGQVKLCQVLVNLLTNAAHAVEEGTRPGRLEVRWREEGERVVLQVRDNGGGIPPEVLPRVFEPLFTTKPAGKGSGLGLGICRALLESVGGSVQLASEVGVGTTAEVVLQRA